jgi:hypothetical protein
MRRKESRVEWHWVENVLYLEYTPLTVEYDLELDAFAVARAEIHVPGRHAPRHRVALTVAVTNREIREERLSLDAAIRQGRTLLELLVEEYRRSAARVTADVSHIFDLGGRQLG